tara:strand:+ start:6252 stop:7211 length:960 start_codon:yes stop_codon:yes gene_type:complete
MAHAVETMAYAGELPWHGLGVPVSNDMGAYEMMNKAGLNWTVSKRDLYYRVNNVEGGYWYRIAMKKALVRDTDNKQLSTVGDDWHTVQNKQAFDFFYDWVKEGNMEMHTAGSLLDGKLVWVLAKVNETFEVLKNDIVESYLLFTNPHQFGNSINIRFTPIRVVCNNTLQLALGGNNVGIRVAHTKQFDPEEVKVALGLAQKSMHDYKEVAQFLASRKVTNEQVYAYNDKLFPGTKYEREVLKCVRSKKAALANRLYNAGTPGSELAKGTAWDAFNTVTYMYDHVLGNSNASRMKSSWYGKARIAKQEALHEAQHLANVA